MNGVERLKQLNEQAEHDRLQDKGFAWERGVRHDRFWFAENLTHLYHLPVYAKLTHEQKLKYNQAFAMMVAEQTVLLEDRLALVLGKLFASPERVARISPELKEGLDHFVREEVEHTEMFWRLLHLSAPEEYRGQRVYRFYRPTKLSFWASRLLFSFPRFAVLWPWLGLFAEEKFLVNHREAKRQGDSIDPLHAHVQYVHMLDESRHVQLDEYLVQEIWDKAPNWLRQVNRYLLGRVYKTFMVDATSSKGLWRELVKRHPDLAPLTSEVLAQLKGLGRTQSYQEMITGRRNIPRSSRLFDERPECHSFAGVLPCYEPRTV